eukprot:s6_g10.t1
MHDEQACILMVGQDAQTLKGVITSYNNKVFGGKHNQPLCQVGCSNQSFCWPFVQGSAAGNIPAYHLISTPFTWPQDLMFTGKADMRVQNLGSMIPENRQKILRFIGKVGWGSDTCTWSLKIFDMQAREDESCRVPTSWGQQQKSPVVLVCLLCPV